MIAGDWTNLDHKYVALIEFDWQTTVAPRVYSKLVLIILLFMDMYPTPTGSRILNSNFNNADLR